MMAGRRKSGTTERTAESRGKILGTLALGLFLAMGLLFCGVLLRQSYRAARPYTWTKTTCRIEESRVDAAQDASSRAAPYQFVVAYEYQVEGKSYRSERVFTSPQRHDDYRDALLLAERFPAGSQAACYVNPENPAEAVLQRQFPWMILAVFFPLIFVAIGTGGLYLIWRKPKPGRPERETPISARAEKSSAGARVAGCFLIPFFSIFLVVGLIAFGVMFVQPLAKSIQAGRWVETPCAVVSSTLRSRSTDDGTSYSPDVLYSYEFQGREYKSSRHSFTKSFDSHSRAREIVGAYRPGTEAVCYVNPGDPTEAVLVRELTPQTWLGLIPLIFVLVGAVGLVFGIRKVRQKEPIDGAGRDRSTPAGRGRTETVSGPMDLPGPVELKPKASPLAKLLGMLLFALFWNGIVSVFVVIAVRSWMRGRGSFMEKWFLPVFLIPFVLIGLLLIYVVGHNFLALFNPRLRLRVSSRSVPLGGALQLEWRVAGQSRRLQRLRICLEGREEATYRHGTRSRTDTNCFARVEVTNLTNWMDMASGHSRIVIPTDTVPSFASSHNKIVWTLQVRGEIPNWPDISDEYPITILPLPHSRPGPGEPHP